MADKIKILFLAAEPTDLGHRRLDEEFRAIDRVLRVGSERDSFELVAHFALRREDLQEVLLSHKPHVIHFAGHGSQGEEILLMDRDGVSRPVGKEALARLFELLKDDIRVVVLNACYSRPQAEAISRVIDYTVGIDGAVGVETSIGFAAAFYRALSYGKSVATAVELGKNDLELGRLPEAHAPTLLLREGADATEPFLERKDVLGKEYVDDLGAALAALVARAGTQLDVQKVRLAITQGRLILRPDEAAEEGAQGGRGLLRVRPYESLVQVETDARTFRELNEQLYPPPPGIPPQMPNLIFVGRDDSLREVKDLIGVGREPRGNSLTVVRGWPGVGKTTLVAVLSRDQAVRQAFPDGVLWTSLYFGEHKLSQSELEHKLLSLMAGWGRALGSDSLLRVPTVADVTTQLAALLRNKRMLLIVDDVWHQGHAVPFIQAGGSLCAVLATTRLTEVARELVAGGGGVYQLPVLTEEHALGLLKILAPAVVERHPKECRELVRELEYLPLSLHVAAGLLNAEAELDLDVARLIEEIRTGAAIIEADAPPNRTENGTTPTMAALLRRSTDSLNEQARDCFAFLGAFAPKPATFDLEAMASVWEMDDPRDMVRRLASHGLIEPLGGGRFQMHALLVQHANSLLDV